MVADEQDGTFGKSGGGYGVFEGEGDVVGRELDVGRADEDVVDVEIGWGAVEVERHAGGWIAGVTVAAFEGAVFDD